MSDNDIHIVKFNSFESYNSFLLQNNSEYNDRINFELTLLRDSNIHFVKGKCYVCKQESNFLFDYLHSWERIKSIKIPNWRERLICPKCSLNSRMRGSIHLFEYLLKPNIENIIYITEQVTPLFKWFIRRYKNVTGSEFIGYHVPLGTCHNGIRNEDIMNLTFNDSIFDYVLSFDVFEHIENIELAFKECYRVLKPNGSLFFTVPFQRDLEKNIKRAFITEKNKIVYIEKPEYHPNPLHMSNDSLVFWNFGWELLDILIMNGFSNVGAYFYWSKKYCYLGREQIVFIAKK